jgi:hypothetical protein
MIAGDERLEAGLLDDRRRHRARPVRTGFGRAGHRTQRQRGKRDASEQEIPPCDPCAIRKEQSRSHIIQDFPLAGLRQEDR